MRTTILLVLLLGLAACGQKQQSQTQPAQADPNQLKEPSLAICKQIEANTKDTIFVDLKPQILMVSGKLVYFLDASGNISLPSDGGINIGTFCVLDVTGGQINAVHY